MAERTEELMSDIERTRQRMTGTVDAIEDRVVPSRVVGRQVGRWRDGATRARYRVMGTPRHAMDVAGSGVGSAASGVGSAASSLGDSASSMASTVGEQVGSVPTRVTEGTQGNPLAAGVIAFGVGLLAGSLAPPSREEEHLAATLMPTVRDEAKALGESAADTAKESAQEAVDQLKGSAQEAVQEVKGEARSAAEDVKGQARSAAEGVRDEARGSGDGGVRQPQSPAAGSGVTTSSPAPAPDLVGESVTGPTGRPPLT